MKWKRSCGSAGGQRNNGSMLGEATLDVLGTFLDEAIRVPIQFAALQLRFFSLALPSVRPITAFEGKARLRDCPQRMQIAPAREFAAKTPSLRCSCRFPPSDNG